MTPLTNSADRTLIDAWLAGETLPGSEEAEVAAATEADIRESNEPSPEEAAFWKEYDEKPMDEKEIAFWKKMFAEDLEGIDPFTRMGLLVGMQIAPKALLNAIFSPSH